MCCARKYAIEIEVGAFHLICCPYSTVDGVFLGANWFEQLNKKNVARQK